MVRPATKYLYRLNGGGEHDGDVRIDRGGRYDGVISIFNQLNLWALYRPRPTRRYCHTIHDNKIIYFTV